MKKNVLDAELKSLERQHEKQAIRFKHLKAEKIARKGVKNELKKYERWSKTPELFKETETGKIGVAKIGKERAGAERKNRCSWNVIRNSSAESSRPVANPFSLASNNSNYRRDI